MADSKEEHDESVGCTLVKGQQAPKLTQYDPITVTGKVSDTFGGHLDECKVVPGGAAEADGGGDAAPADGDGDAKADDADGDDAKADG